MARFRSMKPRVREILALGSEQAALAALEAFEPRVVVGPLFSMLLAPDELIARRAVTALGATVARQAGSAMEEARIVMRRFMWHMNEESGNVGWGIPEAMGEAMARHEGLAREFHKILASYVQCPECTVGDDNFLDHAPLRHGVYWGLGRLAEVRPAMVARVGDDLAAALGSEPAATAKGLVCRALGLAGVRSGAQAVRALADDPAPLDLYRAWNIEHTTLGALAREALAALDKSEDTA